MAAEIPPDRSTRSWTNTVASGGRNDVVLEGVGEKLPSGGADVEGVRVAEPDWLGVMVRACEADWEVVREIDAVPEREEVGEGVVEEDGEPDPDPVDVRDGVCVWERVPVCVPVVAWLCVRVPD